MSRFLTKILNEPPGGRQKTEESTPSPSIPDSPSIPIAPTVTDGPSQLDRPAMETSLSSGEPPPPPVARPTPADNPTVQDSPSIKDRPNLLSAIPEARGHMQLPHRYTDHLPRWLSADEQAVYVQLYRLSWGWGKDV